MNPVKRDALRKSVRYFYDLQKLRIQFGNRATNLDFKIVTDKKTGKEKKVKKKSTKVEREAALDSIINRLRGHDDDIQVEVSEDYKPPTLEEEDQTWLQSQSRMLEGLELDTKKRIEDILKTVPIYNFLKGVKGCGPGMSGVIVSEVQMCRPVEVELLENVQEVPYSVKDIHGKDWPYFKAKVTIKKTKRDDEGNEFETAEEKELKCFRRDGVVYEDCCPTPSALFAYAGLAVNTESGKAVRRQKGVKGNWNPFLKTKLLGVLAGCLLKASSSYTEHYYNAKNRKEQAGWGASKGHRHNHANRVMVKIFLRDLWTTWRELEGLPVVPPYEEVYLDRTHGDHGGAPVKK